ncbi:MAG: hypothetical protein K5649_01030 [Lachnospiraceae bacterium]|nr:hypothetical protein [Lachnospiraceae bacterium]
MAKIGNENPQPSDVMNNNEYRNRLIELYKSKHIDATGDSWSLWVAKDMFSRKILHYDTYERQFDAYGNDITEKKANNNISRQLRNHVDLNYTSQLSAEWIKHYCDYFSCSSDYLLGYINTPTHTQYDDIPLKLETIQALKRIQENYLEQGYMCFVAAMHQIQKQPYQPLDMLNYLLQSPHFEKMLYSLEDYFKPEYNIPVFYLDATQSPTGKAGYHVPHNQIHEIEKRDGKGKIILNDNLMPEYDRYLPLAKNASIPTDNRPIPINDSFMESVAMLDIQKSINNLKNEYLQAQSDTPAATATKKKNRKGITKNEKRNH